jgi:hypothetical protein
LDYRPARTQHDQTAVLLKHIGLVQQIAMAIHPTLHRIKAKLFALTMLRQRGYIPYASLTESDVLGWVWDSMATDDITAAEAKAAQEANVTARVQNQIDAAATTATGMPWLLNNLTPNPEREITMAEKQTQTITIDDVSYTEDQLTDQQKVMINHIGDLDRKIRSSQFNLDQLNVGRAAFMNMLKTSLEAPEAEVVN